MNDLAAQLPACLVTPPACVQPGVMEATFLFPPSFIGFQGHFPEQPILPGIVQVMAAVYTASRGAQNQLQCIKRCKFTRPVVPGEPVHVAVTIEPQGTLWQAQAELSVNGVPCASLSFIIEIPNAHPTHTPL